MYSKKLFNLVTFVLLLYIDFANNASLSVSEQKKYKNLIEGQGLFSANDDINILTAHNFRSQLYGQKNAWLVEFYNSWCGFCQRFAPSWKALGSDVRTWKEMVAIGAIDCSDDENSPICRDFEIMAYPTLRYFHENYQEGPKMIGVDVKKGDDVHSHRHSLLNLIITEQREVRGTQYPSILPYTNADTNHLFEGLPSTVKYVFLIFEEPNSMFGPEIALDLHGVSEIAIKYSLYNNSELINNVQITKVPSMIVVSDTGATNRFSNGLNSRESLRMAIKEYLKPKAINVSDDTVEKDIFTGKWLEAEVPDMSSLMEAREREALKQKVKMMGDVVFQMDLETALRYSLKHEVASQKTISGDKFKALSAYLNVLAKYFPLGRQGQEFLANLRNQVTAAGTSISGAEIAEIVADAEGERRHVFSSPQQWLACKGSTSRYRGYPCGLWKMFHYLTVNAAEQNIGIEAAYPREVLDAMHGYIKEFFGCADCSNHFQEMVKKKDMNSVASLDSAVLWLWMAHNDANKRLAGDTTEDPEAPKIQFPLPERCPFCRNADNSWNYPEVLKYLKHVYSSINVRYIGSDTRILHMGLEGPPASSGSASFFKSLDTTRLQEKDVQT